MFEHSAMGWGAVAIAYALGCVPTGYLLVKARTGQDLRRVGSGSIGARNAGRALGRGGFAATLLGDVAKGALAVAIPYWLHSPPWVAAAALVAVAAGHVWPVTLGFCGGRGVAVGLGALLVYQPLLLGVLMAVAALGYALTRRFQASGLIAFALAPLAAWLLRLPAETLAGTAGLCMIVLVAHRTHLARWLRPEPAAAGRAP